MNKKSYWNVFLLLAGVVLIIQSCLGPSPCDCSEEFYYSSQYPSQMDRSFINKCMKLFYKENSLDPIKNWSNADFVEAGFYFMNHSCHD